MVVSFTSSDTWGSLLTGFVKGEEPHAAVFSAPEVWAGWEFTHKSDVWAVGAIV